MASYRRLSEFERRQIFLLSHDKTQKEIAEEIGTTQQTVSNVLNSRNAKTRPKGRAISASQQGREGRSLDSY
jgi:transcriptional regulator with XRE-family HTH domain